MRRNFAQILKQGKVDIKVEYSRLYEMFYKKTVTKYSLYDYINTYFMDYSFIRGTCLSLYDFDKQFGFNFEEQPADFDLNYLITFCEYIYNFVMYSDGSRLSYYLIDKSKYLQQINRVIEAVGYKEICEHGVVIFVPKDNAAIAVSESDLIPENISYKIILYNHHSMKGKIENKKAVILQLSNILEGKREKLKQANKTLEHNLFFIFNNLNIRHNNIDKNNKNYKEYVAKMSNDEFEVWYDECYQMCLLAFLTLENIDREDKINMLKDTI